MATNAYADVPNLILAGTLFYPHSHYIGLTHLSQDRPTAAGFAPDEAVDRTIRGEHANVIFQAICRGRVRRSDGDNCLPMNAYVIGAKRHKFRDLLPMIFPGCSVGDWHAVAAPAPEGKLGEAIAFVEAEIKAGKVEVSYAAIREAIGVGSDNFGKVITRRMEWMAFLGRAGLAAYGGSQRKVGVRRLI